MRDFHNHSGGGMRVALGLVAAIALGAAGISATGAAMSRTYVQDFETSTAGWFNNPPGSIHRVPSGYVSPVAYGGGFPPGLVSAHGNKHARLRTNSCEPTRFAVTCFGPFTRWGKTPTSDNPTFPNGGYMTEVDVYLDVAWVARVPGRDDYRFDWSSAINNNLGTHRRDFVFNVGTPLTAAEALAAPGYYVVASTNATRSGAFPQNPCPNPSTPPNYCRTPVKITQSGWYTFRHSFYPRHHRGLDTLEFDYLAVDFTVLRHDGVVMANWFISVTDDQDATNSDRMTRVGGDRYGWFVINEIDDLAIDCSNLRPRAIGHAALRATCFAVADHDGRDHGDWGDEDDEWDEMERKRNHRWDDDD